VPKVLVKEQDIEFKCEPGANLRVEMLKNKAKLYKGIHRLINCHGHGLCGSCLVRVESNPAGLTDRTPTENSKLFGANPQIRLACQAEVCGDIEVTTDLE
jgi:ferredoxin